MPKISYGFQQIIWVIHYTVQLLAALSTGLYWIVQMFRLLLFIALMFFYFVPHAWWYFTTPRVIRRVSYRHSHAQETSDEDGQTSPLHTMAGEPSLHSIPLDDNRAWLDVVLPVPLDSIMISLDYSKRSRRLKRRKFRIAILVTGGAWIIGSQMWSTFLARVLASRGYLVFCPDYRNFPQADMEGMTLDVSDAIGWVLRNAGRYNGDLDDVTLVGQSAGAHLTMMSLLSQAHLNAYEAKGGRRSGLQPPSSVAYNVPRYNPRQSIHRYIGLNGFYDIEQLESHLHKRGLNRRLLHQIAGGRSKLPRYSINAYFDPKRAGDTGEQLPDNFFDFLPSKMFFLHGDADDTSPIQDCARVVQTLKSSQILFSIERKRELKERRQHEKRARHITPGILSSSSSSSSLSYAGSSCTRSPRSGFPVDGAEELVPRSLSSAEECDRSHSSLLVERGPMLSSVAVCVVPPSPGQQLVVAGSFAEPPPNFVTASAFLFADPAPECELGYFVIPGARHTDAVLEECLTAYRSCCVDFLCDYDSSVSSPSPQGWSSLSGAEGWKGSSGGHGTPAPDRYRLYEKFSRQCFAVPDGCLPIAVPPEERSRLMRCCSWICPF